AEGYRLYPSAATMALAQNKRRQRAELGALGFPVPANAVVSEAHNLMAFGEEHGWPVVAKASRGGYDGRGVWVLDGPEAAQRLVADTAPRGVELIVETWVPIEREIAVLVARRANGDAVVYPVVETVQVNGICREILAPAPIDSTLAREAERIGLQIAEAVDAVGVLAIEMFVVGERHSNAFAGKRILINELASRPHNSGHYSIEGCVTSQFENHLRAVLDWPLGDPALVAPAVVTVNVLGGPPGNDPQKELSRALRDPRVKVHLYGKEARPGRKLGHVTALGQTADAARASAVRAVEILTGGK
ncbi:MAG TPA: ATP-grasp domain-containing protein, partial [Chloroflexota bacterium]|nr:ATP-grasp domain-containing protein [Chloroflexota bacterium]